MTPVFTPSLARPPSPWQLPPPTPSTPVSGLGGLPPNHPYLQDYAMLVLNNITRLQQQQQLLQAEQQVGTGPAVSPGAGQHTSDGSGHGSSGMGSSLHSSPHRPAKSPRNSSPVTAGGNLTANLHKLDITGGSSGIGVDREKNLSQDISVLLSGMTVEDRRAPGCEKKFVQTANDYEHKKFLATKAVKNKPMGEVRTPNAVWSGLGFSSSMPEAVIREKMAAEHAKAKQQRAQEVASNSDWFGQSNAFDTLLQQAGREEEVGAGDSLAVILAGQGLAKYIDVFRRHEIDLPTFSSLTDEELKEIGIPTFGARKKLLLIGRETRKKFGRF